MQKQIKPTLNWEDAPDTIDYNDLAKILGVCPDTAKDIFDARQFPKIKGLGVKRKADKDIAKLYLQGLYSPETVRDTRQNLILIELQKINEKLEKLTEQEKKCEDT